MISNDREHVRKNIAKRSLQKLQNGSQCLAQSREMQGELGGEKEALPKHESGSVFTLHSVTQSSAFY